MQRRVMMMARRISLLLSVAMNYAPRGAISRPGIRKGPRPYFVPGHDRFGFLISWKFNTLSDAPLSGGLGVAGSNPVAPTKFSRASAETLRPLTISGASVGSRQQSLAFLLGSGTPWKAVVLPSFRPHAPCSITPEARRERLRSGRRRCPSSRCYPMRSAVSLPVQTVHGPAHGGSGAGRSGQVGAVWLFAATPICATLRSSWHKLLCGVDLIKETGHGGDRGRVQGICDIVPPDSPLRG